MINGNRIFLDTLNKCILILFILFFPISNTYSKTIVKDAEIENLLSGYTADLYKIGLGVTSQNIFIVSDQSINAFVLMSIGYTLGNKFYLPEIKQK